MTVAAMRLGDSMKAGFSCRKAQTVVYIMGGFDQHGALLKRLGKHKSSRSCLYITNLKNIDLAVLEELIKADWDHMTKKYG